MDPRFSLGPPNARHLSQPLPTVSPLPNIINMEPRDPPPNQEPETEEPVEELSFNIGMAMLQPEASESSTNPSIFLHPETSDEREFDPYDPVHLKNGHSRTPSPLVNSTPGRSRGPSPDPKVQRLTPEPTTLGKSADKADHPQMTSPPEEMPDPPPYTSPLSTPENYRHLQPLFPVPTQDRSRAPSRNPSPGPSSSSSTANSGTPPIHENDYSRQGMAVSTDKPTATQNNPPMPPSQSAATHNVQFVTSAPVARISREYLPNPGPPSVQDRVDGRSTHHSISTFSSNQSRNGGQPPPHRRVPKHLVMPAPLNNNPNILMHQPPSRMQQPPASPFAPVKVQVQVRSQPMSYSQPPPLRGPMQLSVGSPVRAQEIQMAAARKLRKRITH
ncbi:hypothetical protein GALMADRAFT_356554 [Galerina marginata CBS 339.88]|uniref:Uncharacterized protein n=1 Tax=Galerina marginata (strain CBS 339.88) TaxID=685588 RepID=A0A067TQD1_GALM3|nr:hypothetical protein GALMADRAFT_356554 [Galerina marginata CBS 339.88]